jgi:hypothetical protein
VIHPIGRENASSRAKTSKIGLIFPIAAAVAAQSISDFSRR